MLPEAELVIFADVDTLPWAAGHPSTPAADALLEAATKAVPLVFCSTRTRAQIEYVQHQLGLAHPFISEDGAAVFIPAGYFGRAVPGARSVPGHDVVEFGPPHAAVVAAVERHAAALAIDIVGFDDLSVHDLAAESGLSPGEADLARRREYSAAFRLVTPSPHKRRALRRALRADGLRLTSGPWFDHVGPRVDESAGIALLQRLFVAARGPVLSVGFGDPLMDAALLRSVDVPLSVPLPASRLLTKACACATPTERRFLRRGYRHLDIWRHEPAVVM